MAAVLTAVVLAASLAACSSTNSVGTDTGSSAKATIPKAAFSDHTGITATSVSVGNVSTLLAGIFKGAAVGTEAYADYVNSQGGINGRKIIVDSSDDHYAGAPNKQATQADVHKDFAMVGGFSLFDNFGGLVLKANPQVPNVTVSLDLATAELPNSFSPAPTPTAGSSGPWSTSRRSSPPMSRPPVRWWPTSRRPPSSGRRRRRPWSTWGTRWSTTRPSTSPPPTSTSTSST